jgi:hypothetical protein
VVPSRGSKLIGGSIRTELTRDEVTTFITDGFFPRVEAGARPAVRTRAGLTQLGLPYAQDAAVTRHLAAFLARQAGATAELEGFSGQVNPEHSFLHPTAVLFNGGVFKSEILSQRVMDTINDWLYMEGAEPARMLEGADLDLAVARGAAYYGYARRGGGVRIRGGTARSYYVGVESSMPAIPGMEPPITALCVAPFGMEEGSELELPGQEFGLVVGEPVHFRFFGSTVRRQDRIGEVLEFWGPDELQELNEIQAELPAEGRTPGDVAQVRLHALATEAGTLELIAVSREGQRWKVEFDVAPPTSSKAASVGTSAAAPAWLVGIDLGTTNTVLAYAAPGSRARRSRPSPSNSWWRPAKWRAAPLLPSPLPPGRGRAAPGALQLPWPAMQDPGGVQDAVVGRLARLLGAHTPGRLLHLPRAGCRTTASTAPRPSCPGARPTMSRRSRRWPPAPATWPTCARPGTRAFPSVRWSARTSCSPFPLPSTKARAHSRWRPRAWPACPAAPAGRAAGRAVRLAAPPPRHPRRGTGGYAPGAGGRRRRRHHRLQPGQGRAGRRRARISADLDRIGVGNHLILGGDNMDLALAHLVESRLLAGQAEDGQPRRRRACPPPAWPS